MLKMTFHMKIGQVSRKLCKFEVWLPLGVAILQTSQICIMGIRHVQVMGTKD